MDQYDQNVALKMNGKSVKISNKQNSLIIKEIKCYRLNIVHKNIKPKFSCEQD